MEKSEKKEYGMSGNHQKGIYLQKSDDKEPTGHGEGSECQPKALGILDRCKQERNWFILVLQKILPLALLGREGEALFVPRRVMSGK